LKGISVTDPNGAKRFMRDDEALASPNFMIHNFNMALAEAINRAQMADGTQMKREIMLSVLLANTVIETFLNAYFRVVVSEASHQHHESTFLAQTAKPFPLARKIHDWPKKYLGTAIDENSPALKQVEKLRNLRNELGHFTSSHESLNVGGVIRINGLSNITIFDQLTLDYANGLPNTVLHFAYEIFRLRGLAEPELPQCARIWLGISAN